MLCCFPAASSSFSRTSSDRCWDRSRLARIWRSLWSSLSLLGAKYRCSLDSVLSLLVCSEFQSVQHEPQCLLGGFEACSNRADFCLTENPRYPGFKSYCGLAFRLSPANHPIDLLKQRPAFVKNIRETFLKGIAVDWLGRFEYRF